jgi:hypothetical protein
MGAICTSIPDELKDEVYATAKERGETISKFVGQALIHYLERIRQMTCKFCDSEDGYRLPDCPGSACPDCYRNHTKECRPCWDRAQAEEWADREYDRRRVG